MKKDSKSKEMSSVMADLWNLKWKRKLNCSLKLYVRRTTKWNECKSRENLATARPWKGYSPSCHSLNRHPIQSNHKSVCLIKSRLAIVKWRHTFLDNSVGSIGFPILHHDQFSNLASSLNLLSLWMVVLAVTAAVVASW